MSEIINIIISIINNTKYNPFNGSIPIEKIIDVLRCNYYNLFHKEIELKYVKIIDFFKYYFDYFVIVQYSSNENKRIGLRSNIYWRYNDYIEKKTKKNKEIMIVNKVIEYLIACGPSTVDNLIENVEIIQNMRRGDFVRIIKQNLNEFNYNPDGYIISLNSNSINFYKYYKENISDYI